MKKVFYFLLFVLLFNACSEDESPTNSVNNNDPLLIGTWNLTSVNGQPIPPGVYLRWTFTESTVTITSDLDCIEVISYEAVDGILRGLALISQEGSQCGGSSVDGELGTYTVNKTTLTVTITDPELDPPPQRLLFLLRLNENKYSDLVDVELIMEQYSLFQNYPNPFNPTTIIKYELPNTGFVTLKVYDVLGKEVTILIDEYKSGGKYEVEFNAADLPSGVYFYQLRAGSFVETKKMVLLR